MDGTWLVASPQIISAKNASSRSQCRRELLRGHAGEDPAEILHGLLVNLGKLEGIENGTAKIEHRHPVAIKNRRPLLVAEGKPVAIRLLVTEEALASLRS